MDGLDSWQAFQLDVALATKYGLIEKDEKLDMLEGIHVSLENLMRAHGAKLPQREKRKHMVKTDSLNEPAVETPLVRDVIAALGGGITAINFDESELPKWQGKQ